MAIFVTDRISLAEGEMSEQFVRAPGPGGQNVNKLATAVQLRFDARGSTSLPDDVRTRLLELAGARATKHGEILINAHRFRTRERNREDAHERLVSLVRQATVVAKTRTATRPSLASTRRQAENKRRRAQLKRARRSPDRD
jgi:ribosome-associated protein